MFSGINELTTKNEKIYVSIVSGSISPAIAAYLGVGIIGYLTFGNSVGGNIIAMYPYSLSSILGRLAIVILVLFSYPLQCHPCRASVSNVIHWTVSKWSTDHSDYSSIEPEEPEVEVDSNNSVHAVYTSHLDTFPHVAITCGIIFFSLLTASKVKSLEVMLAFVGSTGSTSISFILPGLFAYTLLKRQEENFINPDFHLLFYGSNGTKYSRKDQFLKMIALALFVFGVCVLIVCLAINIWLIGKDTNTSHT